MKKYMNNCNPKAIALFLPSLRGGGAERVMVNLANEFANRGLKVDMVLAQVEGPYLADLKPNVRIVDLNARRVITGLPALISYLRREKPMALLSTMIHSNVIALLAKYFSGVSTNLVVREANIISTPDGTKRGLRGRVVLFLARYFYRKANAIVAVSHGVADDLHKCLDLEADDIDVIYNPVIRPALFELAKENLQHPWFSESEPPVILSVGRLVEQKGFSTLIKAFYKVRKQVPARLIILGEGNLRPELESLVNELGLGDDVSLLGYAENPYAYMSRSAVYVLSSLWEGLPNTLIEAMAIGTPVVATNCKSGPKEILDDGKYGYLIPVNDDQVMSESILKIILNHDVPEVPNSSMDSFSTHEVVDQYLKTLRVY